MSRVEIQVNIRLNEDKPNITLDSDIRSATINRTCSTSIGFPQQLQQAADMLKSHLTSLPNITEIEAAARAIGDALLPPPIFEPLEAALLDNSDSQLSICVTPCSQLAHIPWEMARLESIQALNNRPTYIAQSPRITIQRTPSTDGNQHLRAHRSLAPDRLKILIAWSDPRNGFPALSEARHEAESIRRVLSVSPECRRLDVHVLPEATYAALLQKIQEIEPHVLHFIGHCNDGNRLCSPALIMHSDIGHFRLTADSLKRVPGMENVRLTVLSACETAKIGMELSEAGFAVIATQAPLRDTSAPLFSRALYSALASGATLSDSLGNARTAVAGCGLDWAVPILICRLETAREAWMQPTEAVHNLPYPPAAYFEGRDQNLLELEHMLESGNGRQVLLTGLGGIGKSQLASEFAHRAVGRYPGGIFWIRASDSDSIRSSFADVATRIGISDEAADRPQEALSRLNATTARTLLIYDNISEDTATDLSWFPTSQHCHVIATARKAYTLLPRFKLIELEPLSLVDALTLLQFRRKASQPFEMEAAREIARTLSRVPLALMLVAQHLTRLNVSFVDYLERLRAKPLQTLTSARLRFIGATGHDGALFDSISISVQCLHPLAKRLLLAASCFAEEPIPIHTLIAAAALPKGADAFELLAELQDEGLISNSQASSVVMHELVRRYVRDVTRATVLRSAVQRTSTQVTIAIRHLIDAKEWFAAYELTPHCSEIADLCTEIGDTEPLKSLLPAAGRARCQMADYDRAIEDYKQAISLFEQSDNESLLTRAETIRQLGDVYFAKDNKLPEARKYFTEALKLAEQVAPPESAIMVPFINSSAVIIKKDGRTEDAKAQYRKVLWLLRKETQPQLALIATVLNNLGNALEVEHRFADAIACLNTSICVEKQLAKPDNTRIATFLDTRGRCQLGLKLFDDARESHTRALELLENSLGAQHPYCAASHFYLAEVLAAEGNVSEALSRYKSSLDIYLRWLPPYHDKPKLVLTRYREIQLQYLDTAV